VIDRLFPLWRHRTVSAYYALSFLNNAYFIAGVWVFILNHFITNQQIGISDAMAFGFGLIVEVPSGALADMFGRKRSVVAGYVLMAIGTLLLGLSSGFWSITGWFIVWTLGFAFQSGATEALVFDYLKAHDLGDHWPTLLARAHMMARLASLITTIAGGYLYLIWFRLPYLAFGAASAIGIVVALGLVEARREDLRRWAGWGAYGRQLADGTRVLASRLVWPIAGAAVVVMSIDYTYDWGLLRPLNIHRFGFTPTEITWVLGATSLGAIIATTILPRLQRRFGVPQRMRGTMLGYGRAFTTMGWALGRWTGLAAVVAVGIASSYLEQLLSVFINQHAHDEHRATTLSAVSLLTRIPYVLMAILTGYVADHQLLGVYTWALGIICLIAVAASILAGQRRVNQPERNETFQSSR